MASRDPKAALELGAALEDPAVRIRATYGLLDYFIGEGVEGGTEQHIRFVRKWWEAHRASIEQQAGLGSR